MAKNPVKKNMDKFKRPSTHIDKKKEYKKGSTKHKGKDAPDDNDNYDYQKVDIREPPLPKTAVIDADQPLYAAACITETTWYVYSDKNGNEICRFDSAQAGKNWIDSVVFMEEDLDYGYVGDIEDLVRTVEYTDDGLDVGKKAFERFIKQWTKLAGCKDYVAYISKGTGVENFRYDIATIVPYKGNRAGMHKPARLEELRKWAKTLPNVKVSRGNVEVDDVTCSIAQRNKHRACMVSADKDSRQCMGTWVLIPEEMDKPVWSDPNIVGTLSKNKKGKVIGLGWLFLLFQCLRNDVADNILGCKGVGEKGAYNLLIDHSGASIEHLDKVVSVVANKFRETYGKEHTYVNHHTNKEITVSWRDVMIENLHLLYMKKSQKDVCPLIDIVEKID